MGRVVVYVLHVTFRCKSTEGRRVIDHFQLTWTNKSVLVIGHVSWLLCPRIKSEGLKGEFIALFMWYINFMCWVGSTSGGILSLELIDVNYL